MKYGYARVSSDDQDVAIQVNALELAGCEMIREEKVSGASRQGRSELQNILDFIRDGDILVVCKLDRLARNTVDTLTLIQSLADQGVRFISLSEPWANTDSPAAKLVLTVMAGMATFERERLRERQSEGIARAKANGVYKGRKRKIFARDIRELEQQGLGPAAIARELKCSRASIYRVLGESEAPFEDF